MPKTEQQIRQAVADVMASWLGAARGSATHLEILRIYNNHEPLARGYAVQVNDAYCATTASAAYIATGISDYTGTECSVSKWVDIAAKKGIWVENDAYTPQIGDACVYDWDDSGSGDNRGDPDHIGIVVRSSNGTFDVIEGNGAGGKVVKRPMSVNGQYIRGFIAPDFAAIAAKDAPIADDDDGLSKAEEQAVKALIDKAMADVDKRIEKAVEKALGPMIGDYTEIEWKGVRAEVGEMVDLGVIDGGTDKEINPNDVNMRLQFLRVLVVAKRYVLQILADALK